LFVYDQVFPDAEVLQLDADSADLHWGSSGCSADADSDSAAGGPRHGDSPEARARPADADSACWNVVACPTDAHAWIRFTWQEDSDLETV
jgi:hypothetical protein